MTLEQLIAFSNDLSIVIESDYDYASVELAKIAVLRAAPALLKLVGEVEFEHCDGKPGCDCYVCELRQDLSEIEVPK